MTEPREPITVRIDGFLLRLGVDSEVSPDGFRSLRLGSTVVIVSTFEDNGHAFVRLAAIVLLEAHTSLDLLLRILRLNNDAKLGAFQLFDDQTVAFTHTLIADHLDFEDFDVALRYVARVGDDHDEALQALAGGERAEDTMSRPEPTP